MKDISKFQGIFLAILFIAAILGVVTFSLSNSGGGSVERGGTGGVVSVWGTLDIKTIDALLESISAENDGFEATYKQITEANFDREVVEAIASGTGPDVILASHELLGRFNDKISRIPYESISERTYRDTYIDGADIYLSPTGILGMPVVVDPLVMYWNRDLVSSAGLSRPPSTWEEFRSAITRLTKYDVNGGILKSGVAFGEFGNVLHAKDILATFIMQAGNPLVTYRGDAYESVLTNASETVDSPTESSLAFYTEFSDPVKPTYSWNRALSLDQSRFLSGDLALYMGLASELPIIRDRNPNLNFDVAPVPQPISTSRPRVYGDIYGAMLLRTAKNTSGGVVVMQALASQGSAAYISEATVLPPVHRSLLAVPQSDSIGPIFYKAALISQGWYDPDPRQTNVIFSTMVQSVTAGRVRTHSAVRDAHKSLEALLK